MKLIVDIQKEAISIINNGNMTIKNQQINYLANQSHTTTFRLTRKRFDIFFIVLLCF